MQGRNKLAKKIGSNVQLKAIVVADSRVKRVNVYSNGKLVGKAKLEKNNEWVFKYKVKPGKHHLRFKVITKRDQQQTTAVTITGRK